MAASSPILASILDLLVKFADRPCLLKNPINLEDVREIEDNTDLQGELACSGGSCEVF